MHTAICRSSILIFTASVLLWCVNRNRSRYGLPFNLFAFVLLIAIATQILDFGLARMGNEGGDMTVYVCTRHYRAPEVILDQVCIC